MAGVIMGLLVLGSALLLPVVAAHPGAGEGPASERGIRAVYTETNAAAGNAIVWYARARDGQLSWQGTVSAGGLGTGSGLGSQGALALGDDNRFLLAVDAGSNELSVFRVRPGGLTLTDVVASGGILPISVTVHDEWVYVVNAGGEAPNIAGFRLDDRGTLSPIPGSEQSLSGSGPAQISFNPEGRVLVVTEKATNSIDTFTVNDHGVASAAISHASNGAVPFGFAFDKDGHLIVSEAGGGPNGTSALSSYQVGHDGSLTTISASVPDFEYAACWVAVTNHGRFAYTSNAHPPSNDLSRYEIGGHGQLTLDREVAAKPGNGPTDLAIGGNGRFLYVLDSGDGAIAGFLVHGDGTLSSLSTVSGLPAGDVGLVAT
jgi:6-phosphogluconolactonase (cycloisomerase 2 family)